jgi:hypothetical protein
MPRLEYFLVSEDVSVDQSTGRLSIFNVLNDVEFDEIPAVIHKLVVVACWIAEQPEVDEHLECQAQIRFEMPGGEEGRTFNANFTVEQKRQQILYRVEMVPIRLAGEVRIDLSLSGQHQATHSISVELSGTADGN